MSILVGKKTLQKRENEIINTLSLEMIEKLLIGKKKWNDLIFKNINSNVIKYSTYNQNAIKEVERKRRNNCRCSLALFL